MSSRGVRTGVPSPDTTAPPDAFAGLQDRIVHALVALEGIDFTAEEFLRSFARPNRDFHARAVASEIITLHTCRIAPARA